MQGSGLSSLTERPDSVHSVDVSASFSFWCTWYPEAHLTELHRISTLLEWLLKDTFRIEGGSGDGSDVLKSTGFVSISTWDVG